MLLYSQICYTSTHCVCDYWSDIKTHLICTLQASGYNGWIMDFSLNINTEQEINDEFSPVPVYINNMHILLSVNRV